VGSCGVVKDEEDVCGGSAALKAPARPPGGAAGARSQRLKGLPMNKSGSEDLVNKVQKQMRRLQGHFLVANFSPLPDGQEPQADDEPTVSYEVVNSRQAMLHHCMRHALQFNSLRYAQYSTMMILYEMLVPTVASSGGSYCLPTCARGRADDGSMMIACDVCDNWFHTGCLDEVPNGDESFVCPLCVDAKTAYIEGEFAGDAFSELMASTAGDMAGGR